MYPMDTSIPFCQPKNSSNINSSTGPVFDISMDANNIDSYLMDTDGDTCMSVDEFTESLRSRDESHTPPCLLDQPQQQSDVPRDTSILGSDNQWNAPLTGSPRNSTTVCFPTITCYDDELPRNFLATLQRTSPGNDKENNPSWPPAVGLFDTLRIEKNQVYSSKRQCKAQTNPKASVSASDYLHPYMCYKSFEAQCYLTREERAKEWNDSKRERELSLIKFPKREITPRRTERTAESYMSECSSEPVLIGNWITVFGFPCSTRAYILQHFYQIGNVIKTIFAPMKGNWVHIKYSSRLECLRALNYHEKTLKIVSNYIMIGVVKCQDMDLADGDDSEYCHMNSHAQSEHQHAQKDSTVVSQAVPKICAGFLQSTWDKFFE